MQNSVLIRCDYFQGSGLGHLRRCNILAEKLKEKGFKPELILDKLPNKALFETSIPISNLDGGSFQEKEDAIYIIKMAKSINCNLIIVDSYRITNKWVLMLKREGLFVVMIDDLGIGYSADIAINYKPTNHETNKDYKGLLLSGEKFFLTDSIKPKKDLSSPRNIIFHAGGDGNFLNNRVLYTTAYLAAKKNNLRTKWICSNPFMKKELLGLITFSSDDEIIDWQRSNNRMWVNYDLVFGPASTSLYEAIMQGSLPISFPISETQTSDRNVWLNLGHALHLEKEDILNNKLITELINTAIKYYKELCKNLSSLSSNLDGKGASRVANSISLVYGNTNPAIQSYGKAKKKNTFRLCDIRDANNFLQARNHPRVRKLSTKSNHIISWAEHLNWWLSSETERFIALGESGDADAYFWHKSTVFKGKSYLIGGWFPANEKPIFMTTVRLLEWQLEYCAKIYPGSTWIATIKESNKAVIALNKRYGFIEASSESSKAAKSLFPGTNDDFVILERDSKK